MSVCFIGGIRLDVMFLNRNATLKKELIFEDVMIICCWPVVLVYDEIHWAGGCV